MTCTNYNLFNNTNLNSRYLTAPSRELLDQVSGSFDTMNSSLIPTRVSSRNSRHLARSFNANTEDVDESEPLMQTGHSVHYESIYDSEEYNAQRNGIEVIRKRLKAHFMTPWQKYRLRGRKPWKLLVQMIKIFLVTAQVIIFGQELFSVVTYMEDSANTFRHLFIQNYSVDGNFIFTKDQYYRQVRHTVQQYYTLHDTAVGIYAIPTVEDTVIPLNVCRYSYLQGIVDPGNQTYTFNRKTKWECQHLLPPIKSDRENLTSYVLRNNLTQDFDSCIRISVSAAWIRSLHLKDDPECYKFNVTVTFDNSKHDGKIPVELQSKAQKCKKMNYNKDSDDAIQLHMYVFFDMVVIIVCTISLALCIRSLYKHLKLVKRTKKFFKEQLNDFLSYWDCLDLINLWFVLTVISDALTILGSVFKILIDFRVGQLTTVLSMYDTCSIFLGTGVLFTWIGVLRYLGYMKKYNILLVTLQASGPSVLRFCVCGGLLYFGFMFCGWIVLGPYHPKFRTLSTVSECLFSLINGDDMFMTYSEMQQNSTVIWVFSKIYLYLFISLFIYVVLSLFIGIISDTYERIKDWGHPPCTKLQRFVHGSNCQRCAVEYQDIEDDQNPFIITQSVQQDDQTLDPEPERT